VIVLRVRAVRIIRTWARNTRDFFRREAGRYRSQGILVPAIELDALNTPSRSGKLFPSRDYCLLVLGISGLGRLINYCQDLVVQ
jgi:hypothetical protein